MKFEKYILENFQEENIPILFIGSGITKRYCTLDGKEPPTWEQLLKNITFLYQDEEFEYNKIRRDILRENPDIVDGILFRKIAQKIEENFNDIIIDKKLKDKELQEIILNRYRKNDKLSPFKIYLSIYFEKIEIINNERLLEELKFLKEVAKKSLIIITTNYDPFLERIFEGYKVITGQELITSKITRKIFKIHGSFNDENSIVITERDYKRIEERQKVLGARLITFFAEHPVIFLGYSLTDENIREFLLNVFSSFSENITSLEKLSERFIIIERNKNKIELEIENNSVQIGNDLLSFKKISTDNYKGVYECILKIPINIDINEISLIEEIFYKAIRGNKGKNLKFLNIKDTKDNNIPKDILIGFGANVINLIYDYSTHIKEIINYNSKNIIINPVDFFNIYLPDLRKRNTRSVIPFYKYLSSIDNYNDIKETEILKQSHIKLKETIKFFYEIDISNLKKIRTINDLKNSNLISQSNFQKCIGKSFLKGYIKEEDLKKYIYSIFNEPISTMARKLIAIYDYKTNNSRKIENFLKKI